MDHYSLVVAVVVESRWRNALWIGAGIKRGHCSA